MTACTKRRDGGEGAITVQPEVDTTADRAAARGSWLLALARDSKPLVALAESSAGWRSLFTGDPAAALEAFEGAEDVDGRIGRARAALELAEAYAALADLGRAATPGLIAAQETRPGAEAGAPWRAFVRLRLAQAEGREVAPLRSAVPAGSAPGLLLAAPADSPTGALLEGRLVEGAPELGPAATPAWSRRLHLRALAAAGRLKEARRHFKALDPRAADLVVGEGAQRILVRDPVAMDAESRYFAARALAAVDGLPGWPGLLRARALLLLGRSAAATEVLEALLSAPPKEASLAQLVLGGALTVTDLAFEARAVLVVTSARAGDAERVTSGLAALTTAKTVGQRVLRDWAKSATGAAIEPGAFPSDRRELTGALLAEVAALGEAGGGGEDVQQLGLVDRHVDVIQRRYALALRQAGKPSLAVKAREAAEDKSAAFAPSARNTLSALVLAARDNLGIGRPRVALKYLTRLGDRMPAVAGPGEMLRDLLSLRAMEQGGSATAGQ